MLNQNYIWVVIEESLEDTSIIDKLNIIETKVVPVTERHKTPWVKQWTLHTVEISKEQADIIAEELKNWLDSKHNWYADFKNDDFHYIIFSDKIFKIDRYSFDEYNEATKYWISLWIPDYQVDFSGYIKEK